MFGWPVRSASTPGKMNFVRFPACPKGGIFLLHAACPLSGSLGIVRCLPDIRLFAGLWRQVGSLCGDSTFAGKVRNMIFYIRKMTFWIRIFCKSV